MNTESLCICLNSISSDSNRNNSLKQLIGQLVDLTNESIPKILSYYSSDSYKVEAIGLILSSGKIKSACSPSVVHSIFKRMSSDSYKSQCFLILTKNMDVTSGTDLCNLFKTMSSDSYKVEVAKYWVSQVKGSITLSELLAIFGNFSSDSYKSAFASQATLRINPGANNIITSIIATMSSDSYKVEVLSVLIAIQKASYYPIEISTVRDFLTTMSNDSYKLKVIEFVKLFETLKNIKSNELITLLNCISSESYRSDLIKAFQSNYDISDMQSNAIHLCKQLSVSFTNRKYYRDSCITLQLPEELYKSYEDQNESNSFNVDDINIDMPEGGNFVKIIQTGNQKTTMTRKDGVTTTFTEFF